MNANGVTVNPGGPFNLYGLTLLKIDVDAKAYAASTAEGKNKVKVPKGFKAISILPAIGGSVAIANGEVTLTVSATTGIVEFLVLGHY